MAPILYARANTVGAFTDVPLLMWYEMETTARGWRLRYSVIFSNEDGGTATDRLMATWGRTTDIEYVYGVEIDDHDQILAEEFQGPGHEVPPFKGRHEGGHPLLWVSTDNNMVSESGTTQVRYAPAVGAIRPRQPVARNRDGSACLDLHRGGAGDDARGKDRGRRASGIGKDSRSPPLRPRRGVHGARECRRRVFGASDGQHGNGAVVRLRSRPQRVPHRAQRVFQGRRPAAGFGRTARGGPVSCVLPRSTRRGAGVIVRRA